MHPCNRDTDRTQVPANLYEGDAATLVAVCWLGLSLAPARLVGFVLQVFFIVLEVFFASYFSLEILIRFLASGAYQRSACLLHRSHCRIEMRSSACRERGTAKSSTVFVTVGLFLTFSWF